MLENQSNCYRVVLPGLIGNVLEWYDFALYGYFASILSPLFFPAEDKATSYLATYSVFAIGFFMRPLGAILFGYFGDRFGRKNSLSAAILLMAIPTMLIGCLPSYQQIGIWAPVLLCICRLLQGIAVGGEFTGSIVYIVEQSPVSSRGFYGSLAMASAFIGLLIGSITSLMVFQYFDHVSYAWRLPFISSLLLGAVGLYLRIGMPESPVFESYIKQHPVDKFPFKTVLGAHKRSLLIAVGLVMLPSSGFYLSFVYLPTFLKEHIDFTIEVSMAINTFTMIGIIVLIPICGWLSDKCGRRKILTTGALGFILLSVPAYALLIDGNIFSASLAFSIFATLVAFSYATIPVVLVEMFPIAVRFTGMSLPYNLANAVFGGTAPLVATHLINLSNGNLYMPGIYLTVIAIISLFAIRYVEES